MSHADLSAGLIARCEAFRAGGRRLGFRELLGITNTWLPELNLQEVAFDAILAVVQEAYDRFVAPIDLPFVDGQDENRLDAEARALIEPALRWLVERLVKGA